MAVQWSIVICFLIFINGDCQEVGPRNISRMDGEQDVFIPCPFSGQYLPAWEINGIIYELFQLPDVFIPASRGILIPVVDVLLSGTMFRCIYPTGSGFHLKESSLGILTVTPSRFAITTTPPTSSPYIYIDHQRTIFEERTITIGLKRPTQDQSCVNYYLQSKTGCEDESEIINSWPFASVSSNLTINSTDLLIQKHNYSQELVYFDIFGEDNQHDVCASLRTNFQIKQQVVTKDLNASTTRSQVEKIPTETEATVFIVLPQPDSQSFDCLCAITFQHEQCTNLRKCGCINETVFNTSVNICNSTDGLQLKFENLTEAMNGSRIFFYQSYNCDGNPYRKYIATYEILEVLPEEPAVDLRLDVSEVCVHLRDDVINIDNYEITVYDVTGEQTFHVEYNVSNISSRCSSVGNAFSQESCQPFLVSVKANNAYGPSYQNNTVMSTQEGQDVCSCLEKNVKVSAFINGDNDQVTAVIYCSNLKYKSTVFFNVKLDENNTMLVGCESMNSTQKVTFDQVDCRMNYNFSIIWVAPSEIGSMVTECIVHEQDDIQVQCSKRNQDNITGIIIGVSIGGGLLLVVIVFLLIFCISFTVYKCVRYKRRQDITKSYEELPGNKIINEDGTGKAKTQ